MGTAAPVLAALQWDPQIRGASIVLTGIFLLVGSVYLLLSTNTGARLGLLLTVAGLSGWMAVMGAVWMVFGIGLKGADPTWVVQDVVTGEARASTEEALEDFPDGDWEPLAPGDARLADAIAAADRVLAPSAAPPSAHGGDEGGGEHEEEFESPFNSTGDYVVLDGYRKGGEDYFLTLRHRPHYAVVQVKPSFFDTTPPGLRPQADYSGPTTTVLMLRDLGNLRFPPFMFMLTSLIIFGVSIYALHTRDKEIMAARAAAASTS
ncbi:MAG TPA: hypothetical protein VM264_00220 [Acidimicrobiales bacterium]|jgi:hypothetical protein|nr:hypothetical protein [Acidimicrobiales bacterium]